MNDPNVIKITMQHAPIGDGKDWVFDMWMHRDEKVKHCSWHSESLESMIQGVSEVIKQAVGESKQAVSHHD